MAVDKFKLARVADEDRQDVDFLRSKAADSKKDVRGGTAYNLARTLRTIGIADYVIGGAPDLFKMRVSEASVWCCRLFERFDAGDSISPSLVSMMAYKELLDALAAGDAVIAKEIASHMGGRDDIESKHDRPFDIAFGYALKNIVLSDFDSASKWVSVLEVECENSENSDFSGYAKVLRAILSASRSDAECALEDVVSGHLRQSKEGGLFSGTPDELLCVWGVGIVNLARANGLLVGPAEPLIPADLLI